MLTMQNAWDQRVSSHPDSPGASASGIRVSINSQRDDDNGSSDWDQQRLLLGGLSERSISAPPSNDATSHFGNLGGHNNLGRNHFLFGIGESANTSRQQDSGFLPGKTYQERSPHGRTPETASFSSDVRSRSMHDVRHTSTTSEGMNTLGGGNSSSNILSNTTHGRPSEAYSSKEFRGHSLGGQNMVSSTKTATYISTRNTAQTSLISESGRMGNSTDASSKSTANHVGFNLEFSHLDAQGTISRLERPKSAAPNISLAPPPGMENSTSSPFDGYGVENLTFAELGLKRPASTGVIGESNHSFYASSSVLGSMGIHHTESNVSGPDRRNEHINSNEGPSMENSEGTAVRPAPKTLMELIQEDFPKSPSPVFFTNTQLQQTRPRSASPPSTKFFYSSRTATASASSSQLNQDAYVDEHVRHRPHQQNESQHDQRNTDIQPNFVSSGKISYQKDSTQDVGNYAPSSTTQYVTIPVSQLHPPSNSVTSTQHQQGVTQHHVYNSTTSHHQQVQAPHSQVHQNATHYDIPAIYYSNQPHHQEMHSGASGDQVVQHQPGPMYVNHNTPYYAVQYAPHSPRIHHHHQMQAPAPVHSHVHSHHAPHQPEYISIVPIHHHPHVATVSPNGSYTYWHPGQPPPPPSDLHQAATVAVVHHPMSSQQSVHGASLSTNHTSSPGSNTRQHQKHKAGGKGSVDKSKGKRNSKRGGGNTSSSDLPSSSKHSHASTTGESPILAEFRCAKSRSWTVQDILGHVVEFCQDQNGSRFIQQRLEVSDSSEKLAVMKEVLPSIMLLRNDVFGNYVVQKLLEHGTPYMKDELRDSLIGEMLPLSLQIYGCRVIQKALETLPNEDVITLLSEFHGNVITCIHDQNGNHVMQKCIEVMSTKAKKAPTHEPSHSNQLQFIIDDVLTNVSSLSCHPYGCRVMQRILEHCVDQQRTRALDEISTCHRVLLDDQYGNYVIQHVLQFGRHSDRDSILEIVAESGLLAMSRQKFASNVVEKLLKFGSASQRNAIVREMLKSPGEMDPDSGLESSSVVLLMVRDAYANYVVQTTLDVVAEGEERNALLEELNNHSEQLRNYTFAKHIVAKLSS